MAYIFFKTCNVLKNTHARQIFIKMQTIVNTIQIKYRIIPCLEIIYVKSCSLTAQFIYFLSESTGNFSKHLDL